MSCSVNIITGNSQDTIKQCLDSINKAGCFSEIVIALDTRTDDNTPKILSEYKSEIPLKIFLYNWGTDAFAGARNAALQMSTGNCIVWLDSDETIDPSVCELFENPQIAYYIHQISKLEDGNTIDVPQVRFFPNVKGAKWEIPIHEQIMFSLEKLNMPMIDSQVIVEHNGYDNAEKIRKKHLRNFGYLHEYITTQKEDRKMQYVRDRYKESRTFLQSNGLLAGAEIIGTIASLIVNTAIPLILQGMAVSSAVNQAKQQASINRYLTMQEINEIAIGFNAKFPQVSVEDWILNIQLNPVTPLPPDTIRIPDIAPPNQLTTNTYLYVALALLAFAAIRR